MNRYDSLNSCCRSRRLMICAWTETSRAETGSSQTIRLGLSARARAMPIRCRWPPENSCGYQRIWSARSPTLAKSCATASRASSPLARSKLSNGSATIAPAVSRGLERRIGVLKDNLEASPVFAHSPAAEIVDPLAAQQYRARCGLDQLQDGFAGGRFAATTLPDQAECLAFGDREGNPIYRVDRAGFTAEDAAPYREVLLQVHNV